MYPDPASPLRPPSNSNALLFLALFLLLIAFFLVLTSMSQLQKKKAAAVMGSVTEVFRSQEAHAVIDRARSRSRVGADALSAFPDPLYEIFEATVPLARFEADVQQGWLSVRMPAAALFRRGGSALLPQTGPLLDRVADTLADPRLSVRYEVEFVLAVETPAREPLAIARAAGFARALRRRGVAPGSILVGLRGGASGAAVMRFHERRNERWQVPAEGP